jgi:hypothetical protein
VDIDLTDHGPGISADDAGPHLRQVLSRAGYGGHGGTGLGLSICRGLVEAHGGTLTAQQRPEGGMRLFTVRLPADARRRRCRRLDYERRAARAGGRRRVQIRRFLRISLEANGYRVYEAENGGAAVAEAALHRPDVIILDMNLPDMDGLEVLRRLREWTSTPVIMLSVRAADRTRWLRWTPAPTTI